MNTTTRISRRQFGRLGVAALAGGALASMSVSGALLAPIVSTKTGDIPTTGGMRPGPMGLAPAPVTRNRGVRPVALQYEKFGIDAQVEYLQIVDGVMMNPTGPWVVGWYEPTAALGQFGNSVYAGHVDYWDVGPAVFYYITNGDVSEGDQIAGIGEDGSSFLYEVKLRETVEVGALTTEKIGEIVGPTKRESLTLITCGGEFDYTSGEYLSRTWVRAERIRE
jgi:hypothetical protein